MTEIAKPTHNRRQLLARTLRYATFGLMGAGVAGAVSKRKRLVREKKCTNRGICRGCDTLDDCRLPQALSIKQTLNKNG